MLNPYVPDEGIPLSDYLQMKFGEEAAQRFFSGQSPIVQRGQAIVSYPNIVFKAFIFSPQGITFNPSRLVVPTKKAHILLDYAVSEGKQHQLQEVSLERL